MDDSPGKKRKMNSKLLRNNTWVTSIIKENIEGKPGRDRLKQSYMKQIMLNLWKESYKKLKDVAMDRSGRTLTLRQ